MRIEPTGVLSPVS